MELNELKGVGPKTLNLLNKIDIYSINDLITHYPYRYEILKRSNINELDQDDKITIDGVVETLPTVYRFKNINKMQFNINIGNNILKVIIFNRAFMKNNIRVGSDVTIIGKYDKKNNIVVAADLFLNTNLNKVQIIPFYGSTSGLSKKVIHNIINNALNNNINIIDYIPEYLIEKHSFMDKYNSLLNIHNPIDINNTKKAMIRLKYEELFMFMLKINYLKSMNSKYNKGYNRNININVVDELINILPFKLTIDQDKVLKEIISDLNSDKRMNRILQGDVGSGKTIVSLLAMYGMINSNYQCALMAPTEILAKQHYDNFKKILPNVNIGLLIGSLTKKQKDEIYDKLSNGEINILIGTHALIQDNVNFKNLGLVVTDEQHRFGVNQRSILKDKGTMPDVLYMSATPIPRTYALTIYGDMDISTIKTIPKGRKEIKTYIKSDNEIKEVLQMIKKELDNKHQIYVVAPLIEDENNDSVTKLLRQYSIAFKNYNVGILHGKMKSIDKEKIMNKFLNKEIDILISTTVIEVGVDVKNATMIVIHNANLFGLSTLHQLRGRVGRNEFDSYCVLIGDNNNERLKIMESIIDGFKISEEDFKLRGSGDLFGVRQSGDMLFKIADLKKDYKILLQAKEDSNDFLNKDINNYKDIKRELLKSINLD
ncbi:MAG TPA: ATP-dependent DNA helicase RecG [Bacilli bacterium]|nr:ATP-dependent DNA helicase RecG [Bacilli bacterium]